MDRWREDEVMINVLQKMVVSETREVFDRHTHTHTLMHAHTHTQKHFFGGQLL